MKALTRPTARTRSYAWATGLVIIVVAATLGPSEVAAQERNPITLDQLIRMIESGVFSDERVIGLTTENCLAFLIDEEAARRLQAAGATTSLVRRLRGVCTQIPRDISAVRVTPAELELAVGASLVLRAQALSPDTVEISDIPIQWSSEDSSVAIVRLGGAVEARGLGTTRIVALAADSVTGFATVTVVGEAQDVLAEAEPGAKSPALAAALGIFPGGGEFYVGNTVKGAVVLLGVGGALAAGYFITTEDTLSIDQTLGASTCTGSSCTFDVNNEITLEESRSVIVGAAVAGAFWLYGFIDGIMTASSSGRPMDDGQMDGEELGLSIEIAPQDGIDFQANGDVDITFIRIKP